MEGLPHALRVLIVDDDPLMSRVLARMLRNQGWTVDEAASGAAALAIVEKRAPDVLLTDLRMPEMDGVELITAVKRLAPDLPQIVMTGSAEIASAGRAMRAGAVDYLTKPIELAAVLRALARAVERVRLDADAQGLRWQREITNALVDARLDVDAIAQTLTFRTAEAIGELCILFFLSTDRKTLILDAFHHPLAEARLLLDPALQNPWPTSERLLARTLTAEGPVLTEPTPEEADRWCAPLGLSAYAQRFGVASLLLAPLRGRGAPVGLLCCVRGPTERPYGPRESVLVGDLAARASLAIENARLHTRLQDQLARTEEVAASLRAAEERLDRSRRMESLGRLAAALTPELDDTLSTVITHADLLAETHLLPEAARTRVETLLEAARRAAALTTQLLEAGPHQAPESRNTDRPRSGFPPTPGGETILLVDADEDLRALTTRILARDGYTVLSAASPSEARTLALRTAAPIALLVTDLTLEGASGLDLARALHHSHPEAHVLFIAALPPGHLDRPPQLPATAAFLRKPFTRDTLLARVRTLLDEARSPES